MVSSRASAVNGFGRKRPTVRLPPPLDPPYRAVGSGFVVTECLGGEPGNLRGSAKLLRGHFFRGLLALWAHPRPLRCLREHPFREVQTFVGLDHLLP